MGIEYWVISLSYDCIITAGAHLSLEILFIKPVELKLELWHHKGPWEARTSGHTFQTHVMGEREPPHLPHHRKWPGHWQMMAFLLHSGREMLWDNLYFSQAHLNSWSSSEDTAELDLPFQSGSAVTSTQISSPWMDFIFQMCSQQHRLRSATASSPSKWFQPSSELAYSLRSFTWANGGTWKCIFKASW